MEKYYCKYCGTYRSSVQSLTGGSCPRHPDGPCKGRHALYQGGEKAQYTCMYCGTKVAIYPGSRNEEEVQEEAPDPLAGLEDDLLF